MFVSLSVGATSIVFLMGVLLRNNYFAKGNVWSHIFIFLLGIFVVEIIFIFIFNIHNFLLTIPISIAYILVVALVIMFYGAKVMRKDDSHWLYKFAKIQGILILSLIIALGVVLLVLIIIVIAIICGDAGGDLSGLSFSGWSSKKKKKNQVPSV